jgi:hypothetical protein
MSLQLHVPDDHVVSGKLDNSLVEWKGVGMGWSKLVRDGLKFATDNECERGGVGCAEVISDFLQV